MSENHHHIKTEKFGFNEFISRFIPKFNLVSGYSQDDLK